MPHVHNALHHATRIQDAYRRAVGEAQAEFSGIERAGETLTPILDLWGLPEWAVTRGERWFSRYVNTSTAPAGRFACVELVNPAGSGLIAVVRKVTNASTPDFDYGIDTGTSIAANPVVAVVRALDGRALTAAGALQPPRLSLIHGDVAAVFGLEAGWHASGADENLGPWYVIVPGTKWIAIGDTAATDIQLNLVWSERAALNGEL